MNEATFGNSMPAPMPEMPAVPLMPTFQVHMRGGCTGMIVFKTPSLGASPQDAK